VKIRTRGLRWVAWSATVWLSALCAVAAPAVHLDRKGERWASTTLRKMTLEEKIGQMIMVWAKVRFLNVDSPEYLQLRDE
jgi:beta-N-acetylhexosaminidase